MKFKNIYGEFRIKLGRYVKHLLKLWGNRMTYCGNFVGGL